MRTTKNKRSGKQKTKNEENKNMIEWAVGGHCP